MELNIPKGWGDITLSKFSIADDILQDTEMDVVDKETRLLSHFSGIPVNDIEWKVDFETYKKSVRQLSFVLDTKTLPTVCPEYVTINGQIYYVNKDLSKMTAGEGIELLKYSEGSMWPNIHKVIALFLWPTEKGVMAKPRHASLEERNELADLIREHMTVEQAWPLSLFFCNVFMALLPDIAAYLENQAPKELEKIFSKMTEIASTLSGDGSQSLTAYQEETPRNGEPSLNGHS